jgi:hypothetical protein
MTKLRFGCSVEVGRVALDIAVNDGGNERGRKIFMRAVVWSGDYIYECGEVGRQDCISCVGEINISIIGL